MSAGHTHLELTGPELTAGILTGLTLCAVLQSVVLYQNFKFLSMVQKPSYGANAVLL